MTASTTLITDMGTAISTGPSATSKGLALAAAGPIESLEGNMALIQLKLQEAKVLIGQVLGAIDAGDGIKTTLQNVQSSLS